MQRNDSISNGRKTYSGTDEPLAGEDVAVVGAGFGGLSAACYLAEMGADVRVLEKNSRVGGVAGLITDDEYGFRFDSGPSWYLMPETFERFFGHFDRKPSDYYELVELDPHYRVYWKDGDSVEIPDDTEEAAAVFESYEEGGRRLQGVPRQDRVHLRGRYEQVRLRRQAPN